MDSVSTLGYGLGYIGGSTIPLLIFLIMNAVGVPMLTCLAFIFALTAVWWLVFSLPLLKNCEQTTGKPYQKGDLGASVKNVFVTLKEIGADKPMLIYILSYFFYIDGVHTIISMSTSYGTNLGLDSAGMLLALLLVQVLGLPFCLLYMKLAAKFGARTMVGVGICVYMFICVFAFFMNSLWQFWMLAVLCATSQGGIQALSAQCSASSSLTRHAAVSSSASLTSSANFLQSSGRRWWAPSAPLPQTGCWLRRG